MGGLSEYVFGYGSLAGELLGRVTSLTGYRRVWGVAADNEHAVPGYKRYLLRANGSAPRVFVAFLDLAEDARCAVNGVLAPIDRDQLEQLDRRERNYDRVDVTAAIDDPPEGTVWTYLGSAKGRARLRRGSDEGRVVVSRDYAEDVHAAFRLIGADHYERFLASSDLDGLPALDLERVDLPPAEPER